MRSLPIGPEEAFVLSRVDGRTTEGEIALLTGIDESQTQDILARLQELGAVSYKDSADPSDGEGPSRSTSETVRRERQSRPPSENKQRLTRPIIEDRTESPKARNHPAAALYDPSELDEEVDLDRPLKQRVLDLFYRIESVSHYELLEVGPNAEKKEIKAAYFKVVGHFHPDKYYGKQLGAFKNKLERIFARLTEAHDTLTRKRTRKEYDAYLDSQQSSRRMTRLLEDQQAQTDTVDEIERLLREEARLAERTRMHPPPRAESRSPEARTQSERPPEARASVPPAKSRRSMRPADPAARRRSLARKLGRSSIPPGARRDSTPPPVDRESVKMAVAKDLRHRYQDRLESLRSNQIERYVESADAAEKAGDVVSAANSLRIAASLEPDDAALGERLTALEAQAGKHLAASFEEQGDYEARNGHLEDAAVSFERAARGKKSARLYDRAAQCLLDAQLNARKAVELAREATQLTPNKAERRLTLGRAYLAAGLKNSAVAELERAEALAADNSDIKEWLKRARRSE